MIHFLPAALLAILLFAALAPEYGPLNALIGVLACITAALLAGGPFILYAVWKDRK